MPLNFNTNYMNNFPPAAQVAVGRALNTWSAVLDSPVPVEIWAIWDVPLLGNLTAMCIPNPIDNFANQPIGNCWYVSSLADKLAGADTKPGEPDMTIFFGDNSTWYTGTGNPPAQDLDLESVALHELCHGFGFVSTFLADNNFPISGNYGDPVLIALANAAVMATGQQLGFVLPPLNNQPSIYGMHIQDLPGAQLTNPASFPNPSQPLGVALTSNNLFFDQGRDPVYAPLPFEPFSSIDHLTDPNSLMRHDIPPGLRFRVIDAPVLAILNALGW